MYLNSLWLEANCLLIIFTLATVAIWGFNLGSVLALCIEGTVFVGWSAWFLITRPQSVRLCPEWLSTITLAAFIALFILEYQMTH